ncbi:phosphoribosylpyrophosphate synthetase [Reichenbachiella ulvae]|uniref:Phosphoribosylpyrophosphate synthetase n=1 Tax=Reichenbachiella ulvae TaxID=2980104 RepID=A0ABT3CQ01_9BACT|nr:phosphoribosylpyrophosphate synthetase [Reichenbachiella ulvae]MCV9385697.1 phosphoribosylpyrophosphate synthetase [Reichenbachiella ulvae]
MKTQTFDTLSEAMNALTKEGFKENFIPKENSIHAVFSDKHYQPQELKITRNFRFEGMTNPGDSTELFAIEAKDGTKGTMSMNYGANGHQNDELIKNIEMVDNQN